MICLSACKKSEDPEPDRNSPVANDDSYSFDANTEENAMYVLDNDSDPNGDALNFKDISMDRAGGVSNVLDPVSGKRYLSYSPATNVVGTVNIYYTIYDADGNSDRAHITVEVGNAAQKNTWAIMGKYVNGSSVYLNNLSTKSLQLSDLKVEISGTGSPITHNSTWKLLSNGKLVFTSGTVESTFTVSTFSPSAGTPAFKLIPDSDTSLSYLYYTFIY